MASDAIERKPLNQQVADRIRKDILSGVLKSGSRLVQTEWADSLGVSRMPVRDAFLQLQSEGILTVRGSGSAVVAPTSEEDIRDMYELASAASSIAARRACSRMSDEALAELEAAHFEFVEAVRHDDTDTAFGSNNAFHRIVNVQSGSPRLLATLRNLSAGMPSLGVREIPQWRERATAAHQDLLDALRYRKPARAADLMASHVLEAADVVIDHLRRQGFWESATTEEVESRDPLSRNSPPARNWTAEP